MEKRKRVFLASFITTIFLLVCIFLFSLTFYRLESMTHIEKTEVLSVKIEKNYAKEVTLLNHKFNLKALEINPNLKKDLKYAVALFPQIDKPIGILQDFSKKITGFLFEVIK